MLSQIPKPNAMLDWTMLIGSVQGSTYCHSGHQQALQSVIEHLPRRQCELRDSLRLDTVFSTTDGVGSTAAGRLCSDCLYVRENTLQTTDRLPKTPQPH